MCRGGFVIIEKLIDKPYMYLKLSLGFVFKLNFITFIVQKILSRTNYNFLSYKSVKKLII